MDSWLRLYSINDLNKELPEYYYELMGEFEIRYEPITTLKGPFDCLLQIDGDGEGRLGGERLHAILEAVFTAPRDYVLLEISASGRFFLHSFHHTSNEKLSYRVDGNTFKHLFLDHLTEECNESLNLPWNLDDLNNPPDYKTFSLISGNGKLEVLGLCRPHQWLYFYGTNWRTFAAKHNLTPGMHLLLKWLGDNEIYVSVFYADGREFRDFIHYDVAAPHPQLAVVPIPSPIPLQIIQGLPVPEVAPQIIPDINIAEIVGYIPPQAPEPTSFEVKFADHIIANNRMTVPAEYARTHHLHSCHAAELISPGGSHRMRLVSRTDKRRTLAAFTQVELHDDWRLFRLANPTVPEKMLRLTIRPYTLEAMNVIFDVTILDQ